MNEIINFTAADMPDNTVIFSEDIQPGESIVRSARLFYVGRHKGRNYTKADLAKIVDNFKLHEEIPIQLDHSKSARDTIGFPQKIWLSNGGTEIYGDLEFRGKDNVEKVRLGLWKKLSIGLGISHPEMKMDHVAVTPFPALEGAEMFDNSEEKKGSEIMDPKEDKKETVDFAQFEAMKAEFSKQQAEFTKQKEQLATMEAERAKLAEEVQFAKDKELIETFSRPNEKGHIRTTPGMKDEELALFHSLNDEQRKLFEAYKAKMPAFIDTNIYNTQQFSKPGEETDEEAQAKAKRMAGKA